MYSISQLAKFKNIEFNYFVSHIPSYLKEKPEGNYKSSLENGMNLLIGEAKREKNSLFIEEGVSQKEAYLGIEQLAKEIKEWQKESNIKEFSIFLPSGTGTTALYLQKAIKDIKVFTTPCVGDKEYLKKQFNLLEKEKHPIILTLNKKHHFGKLYKENYEIWQKLKEDTDIEFDLLYDPIGWRVLLNEYKNLPKPILYIHQGGQKGNETMLLRYKRKFDNKL